MFKDSLLNSLLDDFATKEGQETVWTVTYPAGVAYRSKAHGDFKLKDVVGPKKGDRVAGVVIEGKDGIWYVKCDGVEDRFLPLCTPGGVATMEIVPPWKLQKEEWKKEEP